MPILESETKLVQTFYDRQTNEVAGTVINMINENEEMIMVL